MIDTNALHIWAGFEMALNGVHPYGGDITQVYAQHLVPDKPVKDPWIQAGKTLYALLKQFCQTNRVWASVNGRQIGDWMNEYKFFHRCDVRIHEDESGQLARAGSTSEIREDGEGHNQCGEPQEEKPTPRFPTIADTEPVLRPIFQSKQSEELFRTIENAIQRDKEKEQGDDSDDSQRIPGRTQADA